MDKENDSLIGSAADWLVNTGSAFYDKYLTDESNKRDFELNAEIQKTQAEATAMTNRLLIFGGVAIAAIFALVLLKK